MMYIAPTSGKNQDALVGGLQGRDKSMANVEDYRKLAFSAVRHCRVAWMTYVTQFCGNNPLPTSLPFLGLCNGTCYF